MNILLSWSVIFKYERPLWSWVKGALFCNLNITSVVLKKKAIGFAMLFRIEGFKACFINSITDEDVVILGEETWSDKEEEKEVRKQVSIEEAWDYVAIFRTTR